MKRKYKVTLNWNTNEDELTEGTITELEIVGFYQASKMMYEGFGSGNLNTQIGTKTYTGNWWVSLEK